MQEQQSEPSELGILSGYFRWIFAAILPLGCFIVIDVVLRNSSFTLARLAALLIFAFSIPYCCAFIAPGRMRIFEVKINSADCRNGVNYIVFAYVALGLIVGNACKGLWMWSHFSASAVLAISSWLWNRLQDRKIERCRSKLKGLESACAQMLYNIKSH